MLTSTFKITLAILYRSHIIGIYTLAAIKFLNVSLWSFNLENIPFSML